MDRCLENFVSKVKDETSIAISYQMAYLPVKEASKLAQFLPLKHSNFAFENDLLANPNSCQIRCWKLLRRV